MPEGRRCYCSDECLKQARREQARASQVTSERVGTYRDLVCPVCGKTERRSIKSKLCSDCQAELDERHNLEYRQRRTRGLSRKIGLRYPCDNCGALYVLTSGRQRYCPECAKTVVAEHVRAAARERYRKNYGTPEGREYLNSRRRKKPK